MCLGYCIKQYIKEMIIKNWNKSWQNLSKDKGASFNSYQSCTSRGEKKVVVAFTTFLSMSRKPIVVNYVNIIENKNL